MPAHSAVDAYLEATRFLYPEGDAPRLRSDHDATDSGSATSFVLVPHARSPRLAAPRNRAAAARSMLRFSSSVGGRERAGRIALAAALRVGARRWMADQVDVPCTSGSLASALAEHLGEPVELSLGLGNARANRKPVLQVFSRATGRTLAFAKVGSTAQAAEHVRTEHRNLERIAAAGLPGGFALPRVIAFFEWRAAPVLVLSPLRTRAVQRRLRETEIPRRHMATFAGAFAEGRRPLPEIAAWERMLPRRAAVVDDVLRERLVRVTDRHADLASSCPVGVGGWHGDWAPWNMAWDRGTLQLWDFERFDTGVPVGLDVVHYAVNNAIRSAGPTLSAVRHGLDVSGLGGSRPGTPDHSVVGAYLGLILDRYVGDGVPVEGDLASRVEALLTAYESWVDG